MSTPAAPARVGRAAWTAGASTFLALAAHMIAGGAAPQLVAVLVPFMLAFALAALMGMSRHRFLRIAVVVGLSHTLFHYLFMAGSHTVSVVGGVDHAAMGHHHHAMPALITEAGPQFAAMAMLISHVMGAVVTALLMHRAESVAAQVRQVATGLMAWVGGTRLTAPTVGAMPWRFFLGNAAGFVCRRFDPAGLQRRRGPPVVPGVGC